MNEKQEHKESRLRHIYGDELGGLQTKTDQLPKIIFVISAIASLGIAVFAIFRFSAFGQILTENGYYYLLIAILLPGVFIYKPIKKIRHWYDIAAATLAFVIPFYFFLVSYQMSIKGWEAQAPFYVEIMSLILIILSIEAVRKSGGLSLAIICAFFALFPLFANFIPVPFKGVNFSFWRVVSFHVMGTESFLGIPLKTVGNLLIGFMFFAAALMATGGGKFFINIAMSLFGRFRGGTAKVSIVSSSLFGTISGSATSNVISVGSITIPAMKAAGYEKEYAAGIEACASTGGVLMPPVMGAAAFIIAQFLNIPYAQVAVAAAIPSILYYTCLFIQVDAYAAKLGMKSIPRAELPSFKHTLNMGWFYMVAIAVLIYLLLYLRMEAQAPFIAALSLFVFPMLRKSTRLNLHHIDEFLVTSGRLLSELIAIMLAVGLIVGSLSMTGVANSFSSNVISLAGGNLYILLALSALTSFILGMGMSVTACYLLLAILVAPALITMGLYPLAVHLFIMYWGMISFITPPVAVASILAAGIADANPMKVGFRAMRLGIVIYLVPFLFVLEPALVLYGSISDIVLAILSAFIGVLIIASCVEGYLVFVGKLKKGWRVILAIAGVLMSYPLWLPTTIGAMLAIGSIVIIKLTNRQLSKRSETSPIL